ncbi:PREDICTED: uncharacterized protein LOC108662401 [Theobroma cacao]|uniref:Uncharacterized protein LOC108662401 n=1 Tax=Theobroma cacao TaxID=3641 RepID=A0AB32WKI7_THECC|nr:PREDICTED: uncharacterized protein LOC108662401 [Theobroma cacao]
MRIDSGSMHQSSFHSASPLFGSCIFQGNKSFLVDWEESGRRRNERFFSFPRENCCGVGDGFGGRDKEEMDNEYLIDLQLFKPPTPIKVKILRIWKSTTPNNPKNLLSLDFLIADVKKNVMQAMIRGFDAPLFIPMLKEGAVYLIDKYRIMKSKHNFNVLPEDLMIVLSRMSEVKEIVEDNTQYPDYYFNFVHFKDLPDKI